MNVGREIGLALSVIEGSLDAGGKLHRFLVALGRVLRWVLGDRTASRSGDKDNIPMLTLNLFGFTFLDKSRIRMYRKPRSYGMC
jgi:hypothetical protein